MIKKLSAILLSILVFSLFSLLISCSGDDDPTGSDAQVPVLSTTSISEITQTTAQSGGTITSDGGATITTRGVCWSTNETPTVADSKTTDGTGTGSFTSSIIGLTAGTTYYVRSYATNSVGTGYGSAISFITTALQAPVLSTTSISAITQTTAQCGGTITSDGGAAITARGVCWSTNETPTVADSKTTDGTGVGSFTSSITGLVAGTTYYVRAYATNNAGTGYGGSVSFATPGTVTDIDGNIYQTIKIGDQWWMAENLKVTKYRDGTSIPYVTDNTEWQNLQTGAYSNYDDDVSNVDTYGRLYNWFAVNDNNNIAPSGWHVPSRTEWLTLIDYLGGYEIAGGSLKETGFTHWSSPNVGATNESNFSGLPGGYCDNHGRHFKLNERTYFWSSTIHIVESDRAYIRQLGYDNSEASENSSGFVWGFSVRCVKD